MRPEERVLLNQGHICCGGRDGTELEMKLELETEHYICRERAQKDSMAGSIAETGGRDPSDGSV